MDQDRQNHIKKLQGGVLRRGLVLLVPFILCNALLVIGLLYGVAQSFGYYPEIGSYSVTLSHYSAAVSNSANLGASIVLSLYVAIASTVISLVGGILITYFLVVTGKDRGPLFMLIKIPMLIPWTTVAFMTIALFNEGGIIAGLFHAIGLNIVGDHVGDVLFATNSIGIIIAFTWSTVPFVAYLISPLMSNITETLGEAASCMGADSRKVFFRITLPLCMPSIRTAAVLSVVTNFGGYEIPLLLGMTVPKLLPVEVYTQYQILPISQRPEAMALCVIMMLISVALSAVAFLVFTRRGSRSLGDDA